MYDDEILRIPGNEDEFWEILRDHFNHAHQILWEAPVETRKDALAGIYRAKPKGSPMEAIRYRNTSNEYDNREHFLKIGRDLLPFIHQSIDERRMSIEFVQQWGKFMFCHGYLASYFFEDSDDLTNVRAASVRTRDPHRKWLAHFFLQYREQGLTRAKSEKRIVTKIKSIISEFETNEKSAEARYAPADKKWFTALITSGYLTATYDAKHFSFKSMELLHKLDIPIPPVD